MQTQKTVITTRNENHVDRAETLLCHLVLTRNHDRYVLLLKKGGGFSVPKLEIPRWQRVAPHLVTAVRRLWDVDAICRFGLPLDPKSHFFVLDVFNPNDVAPIGTAWVPATDIDWTDSEPASVRESFYAAIQQASEYDTAEPQVPFTTSGWFDEVADWVQSQLDSSELRLNGRWKQYNMGPCFSLVRYETDGPLVWFKAVGEPNLREYGITARLQEWRSEHLPQVLAVHSGWHGWLMLDAEGNHLDEAWELCFWEVAARSLAALQVESIVRSQSLIEAGCEDLRLPKLRRQVAPFLCSVRQLMAIQPATPPRILDSKDLDFVEARLLSALEELEALGIPNALGHSDINPGNILVNRQRAVFIDWMQGYVGHPFLTFEYLLALLRRLRPDLDGWQPSLREAYCQAWKGFCSGRQMTRALELTPLIAPFALALSCGIWQQNPCRMSPQLAKLLRSLARRMFAEAQRVDALPPSRV